MSVNERDEGALPGRLPSIAIEAMKVLIVDADAAVADATAMLLAVDGHRVSIAATIEEATAQIAAHGAPDALVCDVRVPVARGTTDAIERLRERAGRRIPAIIVADQIVPSAADLAAPLDRSRVLRKPTHAGELLEAIRELTGN